MQGLAQQLCCLQEADANATSDLDEDKHTEIATVHIALRELVDALDNKAAQLYALQQV